MNGRKGISAKGDEATRSEATTSIFVSSVLGLLMTLTTTGAIRLSAESFEGLGVFGITRCS